MPPPPSPLWCVLQVASSSSCAPHRKPSLLNGACLPIRLDILLPWLCSCGFGGSASSKIAAATDAAGAGSGFVPIEEGAGGSVKKERSGARRGRRSRLCDDLNRVSDCVQSKHGVDSRLKDGAGGVGSGLVPIEEGAGGSVKKERSGARRGRRSRLCDDLNLVSDGVRSKHGVDSRLKDGDMLARLAQLGIQKRTIEKVDSKQREELFLLLEKIEVLLEAGFTAGQVKRLSEVCAFIKVSPGGLVRILNFFRAGNCSRQTVAKILMKNPSVLYNTAEKMEIKVRFLESIGVNRERLMKRSTAVLNMHLQSLEQKVMHLQRLGMSSGTFQKFPQILHSNIEKSVKPKMALLERIGINKEHFQKLMQIQPSIIGLSQKTLNSKLQIFQLLDFELKSASSTRIFASLNRSINGIQAHFDTLKGMGFSHDEVCFLLARQPEILCLNKQYLLKKADYLVNRLNRDIRELLKFPAFLCYSLEKRIIPRFTILKETGRVCVNLSLSTVLSCSNKNFDELVRRNNSNQVGCRRKKLGM